MTARLPIDIALDDLEEQETAFIAAREADLRRSDEWVAQHIRYLANEHEFVQLVAVTDVPELIGTVVMQRLNEWANADATMEWENGE